MVAADVELEEIDHVAVGKPVVKIAQRSAQNEAKRNLQQPVLEPDFEGCRRRRPTAATAVNSDSRTTFTGELIDEKIPKATPVFRTYVMLKSPSITETDSFRSNRD